MIDDVLLGSGQGPCLQVLENVIMPVARRCFQFKFKGLVKNQELHGSRHATQTKIDHLAPLGANALDALLEQGLEVVHLRLRLHQDYHFSLDIQTSAWLLLRRTSLSSESLALR